MFKKTALLTILCALALGFNSCSSDDDEPEGGSISITYIIGKWQGVSSTGWEKENGKVVDDWNDDEPDFKYIEFRMDATGEWQDINNQSRTFSWYINDDLDVVIGEKVVGDGTGETYKIKKLNKDQMVLASGNENAANGWYQEDTYKRIK